MKRQLSLTLAAAAFVAAHAVVRGAGATAPIPGDGRATDLLAKARAALGGDAALAGVTTLACEGTYTRNVQDRQLSGDLAIDLQFPDRMLRVETMSPMGDATITVEQGFNGDTLLQHSATTGGPNVMLRIGGADTPEARAQRLKAAKADQARLAAALLLAATPETPIEAAYAGEADGPDGKADAIDLKGPGSFAARLFLDQKTHRPLMLAWRGIAQRVVMMTRRPGEESPKVPGPDSGAAPQTVEIAMYFDDYRSVGGISFPYHVSRSVAGEPAEEWTFRKIAVNPAFKADTFQPK